MTGEITTFYSYKGGTGRSMALACVGSLLAQNNKRVLVIDWDFEAPGLHRYFRNYLDDPDLQNTFGLIDMFWDFSNRMLAQQESHESLDMDLYTSALRYAEPVWLPDMDELDGCLHFLGAGRQDPGYAERVRTFDWNTFYARLGGKDFIDALRMRLKSQYDYVLIDSRTGISDTSGICTIQIPDLVVLCFTYNRQSVLGIAAVTHSIRNQRQDILLLPVAMRVEKEVEGLKDARAFATKYLNRWIPEVDRGNPVAYWEKSEVAHHPSYVFLENLSAFHATKGSRDSMRLDMEWLTTEIVNSFIQAAYGISHDPYNFPIVLLDLAGLSTLKNPSKQRDLLLRTDKILETALKPFVGLGDPYKIFGWHGTGDGYYITMEGFSSLVAMRFACDLEEYLTRENAQHSDFPIRLHIGLCLGNVEWVGRQQLSSSYAEAARLVEHPWTREILKTRPNYSTVLVTSTLFMDDWLSRSDRENEELKIPDVLPWLQTVFPIKHNEQLPGYVRVDEQLFDRIKNDASLNLSTDTTTTNLTPWLTSLLDRTDTLEIRGIGFGHGWYGRCRNKRGRLVASDKTLFGRSPVAGDDCITARHSVKQGRTSPGEPTSGTGTGIA